MRNSALRCGTFAFGVAVALMLLAILLLPMLTPYRLVFVWGESVDVSLALAVIPLESELVQGEYVTLTWSGVDPNNVPHLKPGATLVKRIGCAPGQVLQVTITEVRCNGILIGKVRKTSLAGLSLAPALFDGPIPKQFYFMVGDHPASYDSRFLGLIPLEWVSARLAVKV